MKTLTDLMEGLSCELDRVSNCANAPSDTQNKIIDEGTIYASLAKQLLNSHDMIIRSYTLMAKGIIKDDYIEKYIGK